ncbi:MAG: WbuC family cupin fold metalloprotein [Gammaproteobacteria bacterium]
MSVAGLKFIDHALIGKLHADALKSPRLRTHYNLHPTLTAPIHRMCMAMEPGTYVRPHRHPDKWELLVILTGDMLVLTFDDGGTVLTRTPLAAGGPTYGMETPAGTWHGVVTLAPVTVVLECKPVPFQRPPEQDFAHWAPPEGDVRTGEFERWYRDARPGERPPAWP